MITKLELIEYLKHTPENTNYNILYSSLYNGQNKEIVDEFIEVLSRGNLSLAALQPYLAKLYEDDKTISPEPLPPFSVNAQSDWNQNDSTAADYVKNRPFYTDATENVLFNESVPFATIAMGNIGERGIYNGVTDFSLEIGQTYQVSWDGAVYSCVGIEYNSLIALGNLSIMNFGLDTGEPFLMTYGTGNINIYTGSMSKTHAISISYFAEKIVKIDKKYLPDVQSDWNQNDPTAKDYVKNRPFYTTETQIVASKLNINGTATMNQTSDAISSEAMYKFYQAAEGEEPILLRIGANEVELQPLGFADGLYMLGYGGEETGCHCNIRGTDGDKIQFNSPAMLQALGITESDVGKSLDFEFFKREIVQIPDKYIPSDFVIKATMGSSNAITLDKTFEQIQEAINDGKKVLVDMAHGSNHGLLPLISNTPDSALFAAIAPGSPFANVVSVNALGNRTYFDIMGIPTLDSNGTMPQVPMASAPTEDMQIATKQYVDAQAGDFIVTATLSDDTNCTLDKTFDQIQEAIHGGKRVLARLSAGLSAYIPLVLYNSEALFFGATTITYDSIEVYTLTVGKNVAKFVDKSAVTYNSNSAIPQVSMAAAPTQDMEIATKKYVDDALAAIVDGTEVSY